MATLRSVGPLMAMGALLVAELLPDPAVAQAVRFAATLYIAGDLGLQIRAGYRRRRPHWTTESWRRYLVTCLIPVGALLVMLGMMAALDAKLSFVGEPRSTVRGFWIAAIVTFMLVGACGLGGAVIWLTQGEASRQFAWPRWLGRQRSEVG